MLVIIMQLTYPIINSYPITFTQVVLILMLAEARSCSVAISVPFLHWWTDIQLQLCQHYSLYSNTHPFYINKAWSAWFWCPKYQTQVKKLIVLPKKLDFLFFVNFIRFSVKSYLCRRKFRKNCSFQGKNFQNKQKIFIFFLFEKIILF